MMKLPTESVRLDKRAREQLLRLKRFTGIEHWNVLARWAFCLSLRDISLPPKALSDRSAGVEIAWRVFSGEHSSSYSAMYWNWRHRAESQSGDDGDLVNRHIQRGLGIMDGMRLEHVEDLFTLGNTTKSH